MEKFIKLLKEYQLAFLFILGGLILALFFFFSKPNQDKSLDLTSISSEKEVVSRASSKESEVKESSDSSEVGVIVDVKGAVKRAGVYQLPRDSRVKDAIDSAGGLQEEADAKSINLAQKLKDEDVIYVARQGEEGVDVTQKTAASEAGAGGKSGKVNINKASLEELQTVSGIGAKRAQDIIDYRESHGSFQSVDDLKNVSGIGGKTLEKLKDYVSVD